MLYRLTMALLLPFVGTPDAQAAAFWLQHYARRVDPPLLAWVIFVPPWIT